MGGYNSKALFKLGYGLYVVTSNDGTKDNAMICNTVMQVASSPERIAVSISKANYSHDVIKRTGIMNVNVLSEAADFDLIKKFGFQSGKDTDKFAGQTVFHSSNGVAVLGKFINSFISLKVQQYVDMQSHGMFICEITDTAVLNDTPTMTYDFYHKNVKPKKKASAKKGYICKICGFIYEGEKLPDDYICPICKHGAADFEPLI